MRNKACGIAINPASYTKGSSFFGKQVKAFLFKNPCNALIANTNVVSFTDARGNLRRLIAQHARRLHCYKNLLKMMNTSEKMTDRLFFLKTYAA